MAPNYKNIKQHSNNTDVLHHKAATERSELNEYKKFQKWSLTWDDSQQTPFNLQHTNFIKVFPPLKE